ncbi:MAG TPA: FliM/FliN family flagellar motor switch protein [Solirubrobacteraceae bacterium]|nr:FliM/FliN family flagellar motor switch protein [Solirubrobacteraceae bacterium]
MSAPDRAAELAAAVRDAVAGTLEAFAPGVSDVPAPEVLAAGADALANADVPGVLAQAAPADAVTGPALLLLTVPGARRLAAVLGAIDEEEAEFGGLEIGDRELSAIREATARVTASVASAITAIADREAGFRPASVRVAEGATDLHLLVDSGTQAVVVAATLLGEPARFVVLVPAGLVAAAPAPAAPAGAAEVSDTPLSGALRSVNVRVWAELGRTRMPAGQVVGLPSGAIVELDRDAEDAVDLYVDGQHYATGRLVVTDDESWGVRIERILAER